MSEKTKIIFGVLSHYEREGWIHPSILQFFCDLPFKPDYAFRTVPIHNFKPAAAGRNLFCKQMKDVETEWICMIDNDMHLPDNVLDSIKDAPPDADIVCPTFYMWNQGELKLTLCWGMEQASDGYVARLAPGYHELTKCGTGVIFIKPKIFKELEYPYFRYIYNADAGMEGTEDIQFCLSARAKGFKIYGTTLVKVGHYHSVELGTMWDWYDQRKNLLDSQKQVGVDSELKDSGRSPDSSAPDGVPIEAT